jgi:hypothetical protein
MAMLRSAVCERLVIVSERIGRTPHDCNKAKFGFLGVT